MIKYTRFIRKKAQEGNGLDLSQIRRDELEELLRELIG